MTTAQPSQDSTAPPNSTARQTDLDAARLLLDRMGITPADLLATARPRAVVPTFAQYVPRVRQAVGEGTRRVNGMSGYMPSWVKLDNERFPRAQTHQGVQEHLSPFAAANRDADATAFAMLMAHLAGAPEVVPMVQVENEVGLLRDSRDRSPLAEAAHSQPIPSHLLAAIQASPTIPAHADWLAGGARESGTWRETLGDSPAADEAFMAAAYASYVDAVAAAGRTEFDVPMFVNAWLDSEIDLDDDGSQLALAGGQRPGTYPSGGPLPQVAPIWRAAAPHIDALAPDIYFGDFDEICRRYRQVNTALLIPEMRRDATGVAQMFLAVGEHGALIASPFGVDSLARTDPDFEQLQDAYRLLGAAHRALGESATARSRGFVLDGEHLSTRLRLGDIDIAVDTHDPFNRDRAALPAYGIVINSGDDDLLVIGRGFAVSFPSADDQRVGILAADELAAPGAIRRRLGGDETGSGRVVRLPALGMTQSSTFPIPVTLDSTGIVRISLYRY